MSKFLDVAFRNAARGFRVVPLDARTKIPSVLRWPDVATTDETQIRAWAKRFPENNVGVAGGEDFIILDTDRLSRLAEMCGARFSEWTDTYSVSSGRDDRAHFYFRTTPEALDFGNRKMKENGPDGKPLKDSDGPLGHVFELKGRGAQVTAEGSVHPDTGGVYRIVQDRPFLSFPDGLLAQLRRMLDANPRAIGSGGDGNNSEWSLPVHDGEYRRGYLVQQAGRVRNAGAGESAILARLQELNSDPAIIADPVDDEELERMARSVARYAVPTPDPVAVIGGKKPEPEAEPKPKPTDWRSWFDTEDDILNAPPVHHVVRGIVLLNRYNGVVALPGARKTILCWNIVRACLTGEALLGHFAVENPPERVLFFAAESARNEIKKRLEGLGLVPFIQSGRLLIRSAANDALFHQDYLPDSLVRGSLVIFDTFMRFFDGESEQDSLEARKFTEQMQRLVNLGATVLVMFHAPKGAKGSDLDLQSIRGSGELGAALAHGFALNMQGPKWSDHTLMRQIKNRECQCEPSVFEFSCDEETALCRFAGEAKATVGKRGPKKDEKTLAEDTAAEQFIRSNFEIPNRAIERALLDQLEIKRNEKWVRRAKERIKPGVTVSEGPG
jgi:hypothetical protein